MFYFNFKIMAMLISNDRVEFINTVHYLHGACGSYLTPHWTNSKFTQAFLRMENREGYGHS